MSIVAIKTIGGTLDICVVDHNPLSTATNANTGCLVIYHSGSTVKRYIKNDDSDSTNVTLLDPKNNYLATTAPSVSDDNAAGYDIGSEWLNTLTGKWYKCRGVGAGAAVWDVLN